MISHANAHPNFAVLFMMPLIIDRLLRLCGARGHHGGGHDSGGTPGRRTVRDGVVLGLLLTYQIFLGEEALLPDAARRSSDMQGRLIRSRARLRTTEPGYPLAGRSNGLDRAHLARDELTWPGHRRSGAWHSLSPPRRRTERIRMRVHRSGCFVATW
ncbi:hypothetical protein ACIQC6_09935 [Streptomyces decoyicus]|uniref:hypothetical protein n=1 Tax=Streptomyces decoyicus TaxID=249567 RepID=UPI00381F9796